MFRMLNTCTLATTLLPTAPGLWLVRVTIGADEILATLVATQPRSACPVCGRLAQSVHSSYQRTLTDLPGAFETAVRSLANGILVLQSALFNQGRTQVAALALRHGLPSAGQFRSYAEAGGL